MSSSAAGLVRATTSSTLIKCRSSNSSINLSKGEKGNSPDVDRLTEEFEDLDLIKYDEAVAPTEPVAKENVPVEAKDLPKKRR